MNNTPSADTAASRLQNLPGKSRALGASGQFLTVAALGCLFVLGIGMFLTAAHLAATLAGTAFYCVSIAISWRALRRSYPHASIGLCNMVTLLRLTLTAALIAALFVPVPSPWPLFFVAGFAIALDGADGWLARREGCVSEFGARFDMEVDAVLALTLAVHVFQSGGLAGGVAPLVILLGLPRYAFFFAQFPMPWLAGDLPPRFSRKVVCVLQMLALLLLLLPMVEAPLSSVILGVTAAALIWSFCVDIRWLWRARA